jgi:hypothetical protein
MLDIDFSKLFTLKYWLEGTTAGADINILPVTNYSPFFYFYVVLFCGFLIVSIILATSKVFLNPVHPLQSKFGILSQNFAWMGILGIMWFLARQTGISFVSSRLWILFGIFWFFGIVGWFVRYLFTFYPLEITFFKKQNNIK